MRCRWRDELVRKSQGRKSRSFAELRMTNLFVSVRTWGAALRSSGVNDPAPLQGRIQDAGLKARRHKTQEPAGSRRYQGMSLRTWAKGGLGPGCGCVGGPPPFVAQGGQKAVPTRAKQRRKRQRQKEADGG